MFRTLAESVPSYATVTRWIKEFKLDRDSVEGDPRPGQSPESNNRG